MVPFGSEGFAAPAKLQSNGSIVVASGAPAPTFEDNGAPGAGSVARYTSTGAVDTNALANGFGVVRFNYRAAVAIGR